MKDAKQEILDALAAGEKYMALYMSFSAEDQYNIIRGILSTHTLEPIGDGTPLARECADLIAEAERRAKENGRGDVAYRNAIQRLKLFLKDRKTSFFAGKEPIDDRPFDPTLCGFEITEDSQNVFQGHKILREFDRVFFVKSKRSNTFALGHAMGVAVRDCPWPATQSDGERLLKLLGVLK